MAGITDPSQNLYQGHDVDPNSAALQYGVPWSTTYASDLLTNMTRQQWTDYVKNFMPVENNLINYAMDQQQPAIAMTRASEGVDTQFASQAGQTQRRLSSVGAKLTPEEQKVADRDTANTKSLADVGAQNTARDTTIDRQRSILGAPSTTGILNPAAGGGS